MSFSQYNESIKHDVKEVEATVVIRDGFRPSRRWYVPGKGLIKYTFPTSDKKTVEMVTTSFSGNASIRIGDVILNKNEDEREASTETVEALAGVKTEFKRSRTIKREVHLSAKAGAEAEITASLTKNWGVIKGELTGKVKASVEVSIGTTLSDSETREQTITIDGDKLPKAKLIWIDVYRTGTVEVTQDGKAYSVPFEFPIGTRLVIRKQ